MRKNRFKVVVTITVILFLVLLAAAGIIYMGKKTIDSYKAKNDELQYEIDSNKLIVYVASRDIKKNELLEEGVNCMQQQIYTGLVETAYVTKAEMGQRAIIDIGVQEPIMKNMATPLEIAKDSREYEISSASLMTNQAQYDCVDVRITYPNGEDFLVLAKKDVIDINLENSIVYTRMDEDEILRFASAMVDAYTTTGARLYTTKYVENNLQDAGIPNYLVKPETIDLINSDPNILNIAKQTLNLQARLDLEARLGGLTKEQLDAVNDGFGLTDTAKQSVLSKAVYSVEDPNYDPDAETNYVDPADAPELEKTTEEESSTEAATN